MRSELPPLAEVLSAWRPGKASAEPAYDWRRAKAGFTAVATSMRADEERRQAKLQRKSKGGSHG